MQKPKIIPIAYNLDDAIELVKKRGKIKCAKYVFREVETKEEVIKFYKQFEKK